MNPGRRWSLLPKGAAGWGLAGRLTISLARKRDGHSLAHYGAQLSQSRLMSLSSPAVFVADSPEQWTYADPHVDGVLKPPRFMRLRQAVIILVVWTAIGAFLAVPDALNGFQWNFFIAKLIDAWAWALLTPALLLIDRRLASIEHDILRLAVLFLLVSIPASLIHAYLAGFLLLPIANVWWNPLIDHKYFIYYFLGGWQTYCAFVGIVQAIKYYNRLLTSRLQLERVEKRLIESRLNVLRLQLEPHFLFNALNTISSEVGANPALARDMIGDLGILLRRSLDCKDRAEIPLAQELALLDHYIAIQNIRFGDRIEFRIEIESEALSVLVPSMLLQPLVENAIRHGIDGRLSGGVIEILAKRANNQLHIQVLDDGVGLPRNWQMDTSVGLGVQVTRERLIALYPNLDEEALTIQPRMGGGTEVSICVPLSRAGGATE
jgi:two-component system LytT family sensor kinase